MYLQPQLFQRLVHFHVPSLFPARKIFGEFFFRWNFSGAHFSVNLFRWIFFRWTKKLKWKYAHFRTQISCIPLSFPQFHGVGLRRMSNPYHQCLGQPGIFLKVEINIVISLPKTKISFGIYLFLGITKGSCTNEQGNQLKIFQLHDFRWAGYCEYKKGSL